MAKKKVLHIVEAFGGGVFTILVDLINGLSRKYEIVVAYSLRPQTPKNFEEYFDKSRLDGVCLVEWAENVEGLIPEVDFVITIDKINDRTRKIINHINTKDKG